MTGPNPSPIRWRKSSRSTGTGGECVELADLAPAVGIRDSKNPDGPELLLPAARWAALAHQIKQGRYDLT